MYPQRFSVDPATPLREGFDFERRLALMPRHHTAKGMFFPPITRHLSAAECDALRPTLVAPPRSDRYLPFGDYPLVDLCRIDVAVARKLFPEGSLSQALRRLAYRDIEVFGATRIGRVMLAMVSDAAGALLLLPEVVAQVQSGGSMSAERRDGAIVLEVREMAYWLDGGVIGTLEGVVAYFGGASQIAVERRSDGDAEIEVRVRPLRNGLSSEPPPGGS
ncbi:MAG TPA: DUF2378 family protein [Polyangiaceae bacterium]|nr:DUF2378 family protein [Polyangiaceae bacterium]